MPMALIVHGGAGAIPAVRFDAARAGCETAATAGWRALLEGSSALDAVQIAIMALEDNPTFNSGTGSVLTADGRAQLDAGIMDGSNLQVGAVASVERIKNPILLARRVLHSPHVLLTGSGAEQFAQAEGLLLCDPVELVTSAQRDAWRRGYEEGADARLAIASEEASPNGAKQRRGTRTRVTDDHHKHGTVGAVAVDAEGRVAAGASTGGIYGKHPGRIGDTPLAGCGYYAEDGLGGVSSTGHGEDFVRLLLARRAVEYLAAGRSAQSAASAAIKLLSERTSGSGGLILLDAQGRVGCARNTSAMSYAYIVEGMSAPTAAV